MVHSIGSDSGDAAPSTPDKAELPVERRLAGIDLNLLVALEALLICRNVTHAARRIGQTQPAMSRSLSRLRDILGDDILVRSSTGLKLTARGEYLAAIMPAAMAHVRDVLSSRQATPGVRMSVSANLVPALLPRLLKSRSGSNDILKIANHKLPGEGVVQLRSRTIDLLLSETSHLCEEFETQVVFSEDFVTLVAFERHSLGGIRPSEQTFLGLEHINLVESGTELFPQVAQTIISHGGRRTSLMEVSDVRSAALMVAESKLALTVPRSIAGWLTKTLPLSALLPPFPIPPHEVALYWRPGEADTSRMRLIENLGVATREAVEHDQSSIRLIRLASSASA